MNEIAIRMLKDAFDDNFIANNLSNCSKIMALKEDVLEELDGLQPEDFETTKIFLCELVKVYANAAGALSYCLGSIKNILNACESLEDNNGN